MAWTAWQYHNVYDRLYETCDERTRRKLLSRLDQLLEKGNLAKRPISAPLRDGIFELRANTARLLFYFQPGQKMIFVVGLLKDQRVVPPEEIDKAIEIRTSLASGLEKIHGITRTH